MATLTIVGITIVFPFTPVGKLFGFVGLPIRYFFLMRLIVFLYIISAEIAKYIFYRKVKL